MRLKNPAAALVAASTFTQYGVLGLAVATTSFTSLQSAEETTSSGSAITSLETITISVGSAAFTTTRNMVASHNAIMSLDCGCKIDRENGFINCDSEDDELMSACDFPAGATPTKTSSSGEHVTHTNTVAQSDSLGAVQTETIQKTKQWGSVVQADGRSAGFIDMCSYQPGTFFQVNSTPVDTSAPTYDFEFNPSLLGKRGPFSIDEHGQLFDVSSRMGTFDSYNKFRLRSPVAFTYPSPATWSTCGEGNTLLFGNTDQFYQCGNVSFPAVWNTVPAGYTEVSAQEGHSTKTCVKVKLVWTQISTQNLDKRQDGLYTGGVTWPVTCGFFPDCQPEPTTLAKRGLQHGALGDSIPHIVYESTTTTVSFRQEVETEAPGEDGAPGAVYTVPARTMVFKEAPAYATAAVATGAKNQNRQDHSYVVRTESTAKSLKVPWVYQPEATSTDLHDRPPSSLGMTARGEPFTVSNSPSTVTAASTIGEARVARRAAPALNLELNGNPCWMTSGCGTAYTTETISWAAVNTVVGHLTISHEAGTSTVVKYDNPEPGDGPGPTKRDFIEVNAPSAVTTTAAHHGSNITVLSPSQIGVVSGAPPSTGNASKSIDSDGSKQLIAATIGMAFFAVLAFLL